MTNRSNRAERVRQVHKRGRQLRRLFVKHVRYGGENPWNLTRGDLYYMIMFCPLSEGSLYEHRDDPEWIDDYPGLLNIRKKWRTAVRKYHGDLPRDFEAEIFRKDKPYLMEPLLPVIELGILNYFQPEPPLQEESLYLPPPHALLHHGGEYHPMPSAPEPAHLVPLQDEPDYQPQDQQGGGDVLMLPPPEPAHLPPRHTQGGGVSAQQQPNLTIIVCVNSLPTINFVWEISWR
ncbi:hypothetical protein IL306_007236 [Fusarium sp. DS 682]|nr:hypothetical protein IL306_007236 [Fusarium sp. DS 682]